MATARNLINYTAEADIDLLIPEVWAQKIYDEAQTTVLWERVSGPEGSRMPVIKKTELESEPGDVVHITRINDLTGAGYTGESAIRGTEEKLVDASVDVTPTRLGNNVGWNWVSNKRSIGNNRELAFSRLSRWWNKNLDTLAWTAATQTATGGFDTTAIQRIFADGVANVDAITTAQTFDTDIINSIVNILRNNDTMPMLIDGEELFVIFLHTNQAASLRSNSTWNQAQREANIRGSSNPIFTGALGKYNGALLFESTNSPTADNAASVAVQYAIAVGMGVEALCVGSNNAIEWIEDADRYEGHFAVTVRQYLKYEILNHKNIVQAVTAAVDPS
jgi:N4-gp56 family major capsid protein